MIDPLPFILDVARREVGPLAAIADAHLRITDDGEAVIADEAALSAAWSAHLAQRAVADADIPTSLRIIAAFKFATDELPAIELKQELARLVAPHTSLGRLAGIFNPRTGTV